MSACLVVRLSVHLLFVCLFDLCVVLLIALIVVVCVCNCAYWFVVDFVGVLFFSLFVMTLRVCLFACDYQPARWANTPTEQEPHMVWYKVLSRHERAIREKKDTTTFDFT